MNSDDFIFDPLVSFFDVHSDDFITAGGCESSSGPVEAHIMDDGFGGKISDALDITFLNHENYNIFQQSEEMW